MAINETVENIYLFGDFEVNASERTLTRNGKAIYLSNRTFDLLLVLIENRGRLLTKHDLVAKVWEGQFVEESNLTVQISALRRGLGESKNNQQNIITVQGRGYRFVADVTTFVKNDGSPKSEKNNFVESEKEDETLEIARFKNVSSPKSFRPFAENWKFLVIVGLILIISLISGSYFWRKGRLTTIAVSENLSLKRLTNSGKVSVASLSPDGNFFVYALSQEGKTSLWLGHIDGSEPLQLRPPENGATFQSFHFSSDGGTIYYVLTNEKYPHGELFKSPLFGGVPQELHENVSRVTYSPDEKQIAFVRNEAEKKKSSLIVSDINSDNEHELAARPLNQHFSSQSPAWSRDGSMILVGGSEDENSYKIFSVNVADGTMKPLTDKVWSDVHSIVWLNDESGLIVVADEKETGGATWQLYRVSYPNAVVQKLNSDLNAYGTSISLSSDDKKMLAIQTQLIGNIWVAPTDDLSKAKQVTFGSLGKLDGWHGLDWTPDGKIVYTGFSGESRTIWLMDADGSNQKQIIPSVGTNLYPSVTNDGHYVVFQSNRSGKNEIWRANIDGGDLRQITNADVAAQPHISPDGKWVVYVSNVESWGILYRVSINGGESFQLTDKLAEWLRISPDSQFIACGYNEDGNEKLAIISIDGGVPIKEFDIPKTANFRLGVRWTPDGKAITYRDWTNGIWKQNVEGGNPEKLIGLPSGKIYAYGWSHDGKSFAFTSGDEIRDAILFSNFK